MRDDLGAGGERRERLARLEQAIDAVDEDVDDGAPEDLLARACRLTAASGGFPLVWVGLADEQASTVRAVAASGTDDGYLSRVFVRLEEEPETQGPIAVSIRRGKPVVVDDIDTDQRMAHYRAAARRRGYRSVATFPLSVGEAVVGAMAVYGSKPSSFGDDEVRVLTGVAARLSGGLEGVPIDRLLGGDDLTFSFPTSARKQLVAAQRQLLQLVARRMPVDEILAGIVALVEEACDAMAASVLLIDEAGDGFSRAVAPRLGADVLDPLLATPIGAHHSTPPGEAVAVGRPVAITDLLAGAAGPEPWRTALADAGIRAVWSWPVTDHKAEIALGALTVHFATSHRPTSAERALVEWAGDLATIVIERQRTEHRLARRALHDPLTGLPNRTLLFDRLSLALDQQHHADQLTAVLFIDVDNFKVINDTQGHGAGDRLLVALARRLEAAVRPGDTVARFGGDEFVVVSAGLESHEHAIALAERLLAAVAAPVVVDGDEVFASASIGIATASPRTMSAEDMLRDADAALYRAKQRGRNRAELFDGAITEAIEVRLRTVRELRRALADDEIVVHFQPWYSVSSGTCVGVEALVRWQHPERGLVGPDQFLAAAEESGLIEPLGSIVLRRACEQAARWVDAHPGRSFTVAVNFSGRELMRPGLVEDLGAVLARTGLDPGALSIELTESVIIDDPEQAADVLTAIRRLGVRVAIDDFGTGYSSLAYLSRFPVDVVKIDRTFVAALGRDYRSTAIVTAVIGMAHALGLQVVAEGVEHLEHLSQLELIGCDLAQGHYFSPAVPADVITALLDDPVPVATPRARVGRATLDAARASAEALAVTHIAVVDNLLRFLLVTPVAAATLGYESAAMLGKTWRQLGLDPATMEPLEAHLRQVLDTGAPASGHFVLQQHDGLRQFDYTVARVDLGSAVGAALIAFDVSQYRKRDATNQAILAEIGAASRRRSEALRAVAHEMLAPITAILTEARRIRDLRLVNGDLARAGEVLVRQGEQLEQLLSNLLLADAMASLTTLDGAVGEALDGALEQARDLEPDRTVVVDAEPGLRVAVPPAQLGVVVANLVRNAFRHGHRGTPVTMTAAADGDVVRIAVTNIGDPIASDRRARIFEPFLGGDGPDRRRDIGLGLYIVRRIVGAHGGTVGLRCDDAGEVATITFTVELPAGDVIAPS